MKKLLTLVVAVLMAVTCCLGLTACGGDKPYNGIVQVDSYSDIKVGLICLHDENSTYDKNFMDAFELVCEELGVQYEVVSGIPEDNTCYIEAKKFANRGFNIVFADSFGHEQYMIKAAKEFPETQFCHATGTRAHTENRGNFQNAFASIYEGRYLAGVAAGMKLNEMINAGQFTAAEAKIGYVGAFPYAEVKSGYTSFFLGARSVCPTATMEVKFTNSWYDFNAEKDSANALISNGCKLISQHADSMGAPSACFEKTPAVPNICYNVDSRTMTQDERIDNSYIVASKINWAPYFEYMINCVKNGEEIADDWTGTMSTDSVQLLGINTTAAAAGTEATINEVKAQLIAGTLKVFDCSKFTVNGANLTEYLADVDDMGDYVPETNVIKTEGGITYFDESGLRSAPYFDINIDGITIV